MINKSLIDYYKTNEVLMSPPYSWNPEYIDNLMPFEKELYISLLMQRRVAAQEDISMQYQF